MTPLFLMAWYLGVTMVFLMPFVFNICWIQALIIKVRYRFLIIIYTHEGMKFDKLLPKCRLLIFYCIHSIKIFIKHEMELRDDFVSLYVSDQADCACM